MKRFFEALRRWICPTDEELHDEGRACAREQLKGLEGRDREDTVDVLLHWTSNSSHPFDKGMREVLHEELRLGKNAR